MGLTSTGGVHSSLDPLFKLIEIGKEYGLKETYVHCFMDGRDTDPKSGKGFIEEVQACCDKNLILQFLHDLAIQILQKSMFQ